MPKSSLRKFLKKEIKQSQVQHPDAMRKRPSKEPALSSDLETTSPQPNIGDPIDDLFDEPPTYAKPRYQDPRLQEARDELAVLIERRDEAGPQERGRLEKERKTLIREITLLEVKESEAKKRGHVLEYQHGEEIPKLLDEGKKQQQTYAKLEKLRDSPPPKKRRRRSTVDSMANGESLLQLGRNPNKRKKIEVSGKWPHQIHNYTGTDPEMKELLEGLPEEEKKEAWVVEVRKNLATEARVKARVRRKYGEEALSEAWL